jgi:Xaa-Pro aminopeptidase
MAEALQPLGQPLWPPELPPELPELTFKAGMMVVIQPNVIMHDGKAGVQTGECVLLTKTGIERPHTAPRGFVRL